MKLTVEIVNDKFKFEYEIGPKSRHGGEADVCETSLIGFVDMINICHKIFSSQTAESMREINALAYIEIHPELIEKYKKRIVK